MLHVCNDKEKANVMNYYFATIGEKLASCFPVSTQNPIASYVTRVTPAIDNVNLSEELLRKKLNKTNTKKAGGPDSITSREMKVLANQLSDGVSFISNLSFREVTSHLATRKTRHQQPRHQCAIKVATKTSYLATMLLLNFLS